MRLHLAIVMLIGGIFALSATADAAPKGKRGANPSYYYYAPQPYYSARERWLCEERAQAEDPTGRYAGYPCWAREIFGRGTSGGRGR